ncbi:MAG: RICIN domain-containing protein, partial [Thermoplasmata archaeon]|nr:RICIN domain-containing protein [Thermoplasmata archaeon]
PKSGWTKINHDLNAGAGGKYIYLCVKDAIKDDVKIITGSSSGISPGSGWTKINKDLNQGTGGKYIYLCVKESLVNHIKVISGSSSHISAGTGWTKIHKDLNEGAGGKYIYICIKNDENNPAIITKTVPLATYREDCMLTGFTMNENHGAEAGVFYSADRNQTLKAYVALNYDFLKNQTPLSQAPDKLSEYDIDVHHEIKSFSHLDASVKGMTSMVRDAMKKLPDGKVLPVVLVGTDISSNCAMGEFAAGSTHQLGTEFHVDLTVEPDVTMKSLNTVWVDTTTEEVIQFDELVQEIKTWEWDDINETTDMALLFFLWNVGETVVINVDDIEIKFEVPETPEILEELHQSFSGFEHLVGPIVENLAKYYWTRSFDKVKFGILDDLNVQWGELDAETQEFQDTRVMIREVGSAKNYAQLEKAVGGEVVEEQLTGIGSKLEIFAKALMIIGILIVIGVAIYTFISIGNAGGWSGFSIALGIAVVVLQVLYFLIILGICLIPVVGWIIGLIIVLADIIASFFGYGSGWIMKKIIDAICDFKLRSNVDLDMQNTNLLVTDHDDNGLTAGDRIEMRSRIIETINKTDDGDHSDVTDSYITPHYRVSTHSCSDAGMGIKTKSGTFRNTLYRETHHSKREVDHDVGLWVEPGCSMINFPITTRLHADYKVYYKECCCWICSTKHKLDSQTSDASTFYFDVLPNTLDDFLGWNAITVNDRDSDGLQDTVEAGNDVYYELVQNATGKVIDGSSGSMYMLDWKDSENQKWNLEPVENGEFRITQKASGQAIDGNGAEMYLDSWNGGDFQRWELDPVGGGYYRIRQNATGKVIDGNGDHLYMRDWNGGDYQKWTLKVAGTDTDPHAWDSDGDGLSDWYEVNTVIEYGCSATDADSDDDGLNDAKELHLGTSPLKSDTDDDGLTDYQEHRGWKITFTYCGQQFTAHVWSDPLTNDSDLDGLTDYEEYQRGLNPRSDDTDGDGIKDGDTFPYIPTVTDYIRNVKLNGGGNTLFVDPSEQIGVTLDYRDWNPVSSDTEFWNTNYLEARLEMNHLETIYEGLPPESPDVTTGSADFSFTAPDAEGLYILKYDVNITHSKNMGDHWDLGVVQVVDGTSFAAIRVIEGGGRSSSSISLLTSTLSTRSGRDDNWTDPDQVDLRESDGDGLTDLQELGGWVINLTNASNGTSAIHVTSDPLLSDTDHDGLSDGLELILGTDPRSMDSDGDGLSDGVEYKLGMDITLHDEDGDGLDDAAEMLFGCDPTMNDTDSDGLPDDQEVLLGSDPTSNDTDHDGLDDAVELMFNSSLGKPDSDEDQLFDKMEFTLGTDPWNPDTDGDGLADGLEYFMNTDPLANDTDSDGLPDGRELDLGLDPSVNDTDGDGLDDELELELGSNPLSPDTDNDRIPDARDHDTFVRNVDEIILVFDPLKDSYGFRNLLSEYVNIIEATPAELRANYSNARYIVIVGRPYPDPENDTAGNLMYDIMRPYGWNLTPLQESGYDRITVEYGLWNRTQTIVMLTHPFPTDHWRVLSILKGMNVTVLPDTVRVEYPAPRPFFHVDGIREIDTFITVKLLEEVTPDVELHRYNASTIPTVLDHRSGLIGDEVAVGHYLEIIPSANMQNESSEIIDFMWIQLYFTAADLDRNGDMDAVDPEDVNESTLCVYYFDGSKNTWIRLTNDLDWVNEVGVNTTNVELYGKEYEGYVWVNVSHFCLFGLAGESTLPPADEKEKEFSTVLALLGSILVLLIALLLTINVWYPDPERRKKERRKKEGKEKSEKK